ncbi:CDGP domain-containing protein [Mycobacterium sp. MMS18-G62]
MKRCIVGGLAVLLMAAGLMASELMAAAPQASAGCLYGGPYISKCDGPVQPDGTWQRCVAVPQVVPRGASSYLIPVKNCDLMGPDQFPADFALADPPTHID